MSNISEKLAEEHYGIISKHEKMINNELRFRLCSNDGSGYIKTVAGENGAWQNSHFHHSIREMYIVQSGWLAFSYLMAGKFEMSIYRMGEHVTSQPHVSHNIYLPAGAEIHTVKYGMTTKDDWHEDAELNQLTQRLTEDDIETFILKNTPKG